MIHFLTLSTILDFFLSLSLCVMGLPPPQSVCEAAFKFYHILGDNIYDAFSAKYTCKSAFIFHHSVVY